MKEFLRHTSGALAFLLSMSALPVIAQDSSRVTPKDTRPLADRFWFGGGIGLNFGTVTAIQLEPMVGYYVDKNNKLSVGTGLSYWYYRDNRFVPALVYDGLGYRIFTRVRPIDQFFAHAEFYHLNAERYFQFEDVTRRIWIPHLLVGGGYVQSLGGNSSIYFQVLFDVLQDPNSIYGDQPVFGGGIGIGF